LAKPLNNFQAVCLVAGSGIGGGVMAVPILVDAAGLLPALLVMALAYVVTLTLHIMIGELCLRSNNASELISVFQQHLFGSNKLLLAVFYALMAVVLSTNLAAYVAGAGEIIVSLTGWPLALGSILFFVLAGVVVFFGLKQVALNESWLVPLMLVVLLALLVLTLAAPQHQALPLLGSLPSKTLAVYGMTMFALSSLFSVPQVASGLANPRRNLPKVVALGLGVNLAVIVVVTLCTLAASSHLSQVAIIGWVEHLAPQAKILGSLFIIFAMLSTFWSISLQLADMTREFFFPQADINFWQRWLQRSLPWLVATLPSLALALLTPVGFMDLMSIAGGAVAVIVALLVVPAYRQSIKGETAHRALLLGRLGRSAPLAGAVVACYILMAVGSFL
jgi:amino acid permease